MRIDFHIHIFPRAIRDQRERFFKDEPAFRLLYDDPRARLVGVDELITMLDDQQIDKAVIFGFPWCQETTFRRHNDYIIEAVARYPERLWGLGCMDIMHPQAAREAERCLAAGLSGLGELAFYGAGIDETALKHLTPLMELCQSYQRLVLLHTNEPVGYNYPGKSPNTLRQIYTIAQRFFENTIVLAHWGGGIFFYKLLKKEVRQVLQNVYFDTAASPYLYEPDIYRLAGEIAGVDKVLFGSDYPLIQPRRYLEEIEASGLDAAGVEAICGGNAQRLLVR